MWIIPAVTFILGVIIGLYLAAEVVNYQARRGLLYYFKDGEWRGNKPAIIRDINARALRRVKKL